MTIGILGGGQLGYMLALAGYPLGLHFRFLDPSPEAPVGRIAQRVTADYTDQAALEKFSSGLELVTYEFENVPVEAARFLAERVPVYPPPPALEAAQDRLAEKDLFRKLGIATTEFAPVSNTSELDAAVKTLGLPAVLKTSRMGYDGKGQWILRDRSGILRLSLAPAPRLDPEIQRAAERAAHRLLESLKYVGVLAIEFFEHQGELLANEMAPRVHNSGHWTIEGAVTSQFENHLRAVLGLPLGSPGPAGHCAMLNLIGDLPDSSEVLAVPDAHLHLYGKSPRLGRKLGHVTLRAASPERLALRLSELPAFFHRPDFCLDAALAPSASLRA